MLKQKFLTHLQNEKEFTYYVSKILQKPANLRRKLGSERFLYNPVVDL